MSATDSKAAAESPLQADLVALLEAMRVAERDLFAALPGEQRDAPGTIGEWSAKDVLAHMAAWRAIEARRLLAAATGDPTLTAGDPAPGELEDRSNAQLHAERAGRSWEEVQAEAAESTDALIAAIRRSSTDALCECDQMVAGIGVNGANHALGHLSDISRLAGDGAAFHTFARAVEGVARRNHMPPRDSGVLLYNIACHRSLTGDADGARGLLRDAFARRHELREAAQTDPDLEALRGDFETLSGNFG